MKLYSKRVFIRLTPSSVQYVFFPPNFQFLARYSGVALCVKDTCNVASEFDQNE